MVAGRSARVRRAWWGALAMVVAGCASVASSLPIDKASDLVGEWQRVAAGMRGRAVTRILIGPDGAYAGTVYFDRGDRPFMGKIVPRKWGPARYSGLDGSGTVRLRQQPDGSRVLTFVPDGGGGRAEFSKLDPAP